MSQPTITRLFLDVHMGASHNGLEKLAIKGGVKLKNLGESDLIMFLNKKMNRLKVLGAQGKVIGYLRMPGNERIELNALRYLPATFGANGFDYKEACRAALYKKLEINNG